MLIVLTDNSRSSSPASITGATATIALVPQMDVPAPTKSAVLADALKKRPQYTAAAVPVIIAPTITSRYGAPLARSVKLRVAPVSTMVMGITRRTSPLHPSNSALGKEKRLRKRAP